MPAESGKATDVGRVRASNQDRLLTSDNLFAVADGMGGHVGGEVASRMALEGLQDAFSRQPTLEGLRDAVEAANTAVWNRGQEDQDLRGMGTTLTVVALVGGTDGRDLIGLANVGDSRAYLLSDGTLSQLTNDHSLAEEKVRQGEMTEEQAAVHPHRHILTRALGVAATVDVDLWKFQVRTGDRLLICSDGLTNELSLTDIAEVLTSVRDPRKAARTLVKKANEKGGNDNITVVVIDVLVGEVLTGAPLVEIVPLQIEEDGSAPNGLATGTNGSNGLQGANGAGMPAAPGDSDRPPTATGSSGAEGLAANSPGGGVIVEPRAGRAPTVVQPGAPVLAKKVSEDVFVGSPPQEDGSRTANAGRSVAPAGLPRPRETRGERRRRLGIPHRITLRVIVFFVLFAVFVTSGYVFVRWYANDNWYVTVNKAGYVVVYQGRPGGLLGFKPKVVDLTTLQESSVPAEQLPALKATVQEPSLKAAERYVQNLKNESFGYILPSALPAPAGHIGRSA